mmetsp:Transcript_47542/g.87362  ORF Transcript_47542/g.87362 Transcript_47542/m.87362 type:complete len:271 (+) Transcript_47542:78-890(+)
MARKDVGVQSALECIEPAHIVWGTVEQVASSSSGSSGISARLRQQQQHGVGATQGTYFVSASEGSDEEGRMQTESRTELKDSDDAGVTVAQGTTVTGSGTSSPVVPSDNSSSRSDADDGGSDNSAAVAPKAKLEHRPAWSAGAALHVSGQCKPCAHYITTHACYLGFACEFCHLCDAEDLRLRRRQRIKAQKKRKRRLKYAMQKSGGQPSDQNPRTPLGGNGRPSSSRQVTSSTHRQAHCRDLKWTTVARSFSKIAFQRWEPTARRYGGG